MTASSPDTDVSSGRQPRQATPAGARVAYDRTGRGEPRVLLHGPGVSPRCWDPSTARLAYDPASRAGAGWRSYSEENRPSRKAAA